MDLIPIHAPWYLKLLFPKLIWNINTNEKVIYLTFDDGPTPEVTNWVLNLLSTYNAQATFFCIGNNIARHPEVFKTILREGHVVGNHTYDHLKAWDTNNETYIDNIDKTQKLIDQYSPDSPKLFRPPHGQTNRFKNKKILALGYKIIMWHTLSKDWKSGLDKDTIIHKIFKHTKPGSIIVFHDSVKATDNMKYILKKVLERFSKEGYSFKGLS